MKSMGPAEWREFRLFGTSTGKVATTRSSSHPHVAPVWFVLDGNELVFTTGKTSVKGKKLLRDSHVMISVDDEQPPFAFVLTDGMAAIEELSSQELLPWATRIANRYVAAGKADAYAKRNAAEGELLVRVPVQIGTITNLSPGNWQFTMTAPWASQLVGNPTINLSGPVVNVGSMLIQAGSLTKVIARKGIAEW